jgi:nucleoside-diphosphate-sugar epimerase
VEDIIKPSKALDKAVHGVKYLFHVASPFRFDGDPVKDIVEPAVEGTKTVLEAASRSDPPVSRVVVTSSVCGELTCGVV